MNQNESDLAARRSIHACCDTDTIVGVQLSRISPIRGVKQFGKLPLSKAQAAVQQSAAQILLHAFSHEFPDQAHLHYSVSLASINRLAQLFWTLSGSILFQAPGTKITVSSSPFCDCWALYFELNVSRCRDQLRQEPEELLLPPPCLTWWMPSWAAVSWVWLMQWPILVS